MSEQALYVLPRSGWKGVPAAGEFFYLKKNLSLFERRPTKSQPAEAFFDVTLVPEPDNPHDPHAVSLRHEGNIVGYLPADVAAGYHLPVQRIVASGAEVRASARAYGQVFDGKPDVSVTVGLPEPSAFFPLNSEYPAAVSVLPYASQGYQVLKEEDHFEHIFEYVPRSGTGMVIVTLHRSERMGGRGVMRAVVEVRLDGEAAGELSAVASSALLPVIDHAQALGKVVGSWAKLTGSGLAAELVLKCAKVSTLEDDWLREMPVFPRLVPEAHRYDVPAAFTDEGHRMDPAVQAKAAAAFRDLVQHVSAKAAEHSEVVRPGQNPLRDSGSAAPGGSKPEAAPAKKRSAAPAPPANPTPEPLSDTVTRLGLGEGDDRPIFYSVRGKSVHVTDKDRSSAGKNPRRTAWIVIACVLVIGLLLGLVPGIGPFLFLVAVAFAWIGGVDQLRKAAVLEVDPTGAAHPPMTMARDAQDADFDRLGEENQDLEDDR
ncbi:HIRAN domain-containing protein [Micrococcus lylae]|uniref:HIRAN domain-containing protein n=1 Tax=Micrococcus lylae TaxID=1273 RepID=UPI000C7F87DC|nr:HIRAN domain-containing protein [Micrococcus lylae]WIK82123.1 hypothetical protein CJ228_011145 [Micrococcus lylae]